MIYHCFSQKASFLCFKNILIYCMWILVIPEFGYNGEVNYWWFKVGFTFYQDSSVLILLLIWGQSLHPGIQFLFLRVGPLEVHQTFQIPITPQIQTPNSLFPMVAVTALKSLFSFVAFQLLPALELLCRLLPRGTLQGMTGN